MVGEAEIAEAKARSLRRMARHAAGRYRSAIDLERKHRKRRAALRKSKRRQRRQERREARSKRRT